ncbi:hypothetical protein [Lewinella sp. W8]|uniref:hypothetical protein n=1 Tax=Lewinella sp. W8 TaxID=2528208 RepID=UPI0010684EEE|nr:hypothetical protein [Lewinella sp. W8]MTB53591.1 hypothetical protein [Lewinella sp. W8]
MVLKKLLLPSALLLLLDWARLLWKLRRHRSILAAHRILPWVPLVANGYLRLYFLLESPVPGSCDSRVKTMRKNDSYRGAWSANVENGCTIA